MLMATKREPGEFDCYTAADPDEPIFVLLGRDPLAGDLVIEWARRRAVLASIHSDDAERDARKIAEARACGDAMRAWWREGQLTGRDRQQRHSLPEVAEAPERSFQDQRIDVLETELGEIAETWELMASEIGANPGPLSAEQKATLGEMCRQAAVHCRGVQWDLFEDLEI